MSVDTFICGSCEICFFNLDEFVTHKKLCTKDLPSVTENLEQADITTTESESTVNVQPTESGSVCDGIQQSDPDPKPGSTVELVVVNQTEKGGDAGVDCEVVVRGPQTQTPAAGKRKGRPKRSDVKKKPVPVTPSKPEKPELPEMGVDGKFRCPRCKLSFTRERTFKAHKCIAASDYVDVTKKEVVSDPDSTEDVEDDDDDEETHFAKLVKKPPTRKRRRRAQIIVSDPVNLQNMQVSLTDTLGGGDGTAVSVPSLNQPTVPTEVNESGDMTLLDPLSTTKAPLFRTEQDRLEFEEAINVDLSMVDEMYAVHMIEQNLNDEAIVDMPRSNQLTIFSCNTCDKVFKTLSHMRLHCLTHTDLKPFNCPKCKYSSNSKGNMYTHMRKHTGQFYMCSHCSFMTVNKTHLREHEDTHNGKRHECRICKKDYNTMKSLVNHVRKYHGHKKDGQEFLETIQPKTNRMNGLLYLCHVCNRKFKKKVDRDRHLFVHNIRDSPNVVTCDLCDYVASRRVYLLAHFKKHRIVYNCSLCKEKFLSTIRLQNHVIEKHQEAYNSSTWEEMFAKCIDNSVYLPEHSHTEVHSNIPVELTAEGNTQIVEAGNTQIVEANTQDPEQATSEKEGKEEKEDIFQKLGYRQLSLKVLEKLRDTFGHMECEFCGRLFGSRLDYDPHMRTHTGEKPFACELCSYRGPTKDSLKRHAEKEHDETTYPCSECNFVAKNKTLLWSHSQKHISTVCTVCNQKLMSKKKLRLHLRVKHPEVTHDEVDKMTGVTKHHIRGKIGKKTFKCPYCERTFLRSAADLQKHIWIHQDVKPFQCQVCSYACRSKNNLKSHMLRHSSHKPFSCEFCGKAYKSKTARRWHERSHREGKMKCDKCNYEATQKSHLKRHMETHDIVKQYVCQHCDYSANTIGYMKIHYTRFHKGVQFSSAQSKIKNTVMDAKVFKCLSCDYLFGNLSDMKRHLRIRHHIQVEDMHALDSLNLDPTQPSQLCIPIENAQDLGAQEVQVVHLADSITSTSQEIDATAALQALQYSGGEQVNIDEKTASAVSILQQIIDMSQQGTVTQSEEGDQGLIAVNPEAIIVHQDGEVVVSSTKADGTPEQVVIQYIQSESDDPNITTHVVSEPTTEIITMTTESTEVE